MLGIFNGAATKAGTFIIHLVHLRNHYSGKRSICTATRNRIIMFQLDDDDDNDKLKVRFFLHIETIYCSNFFFVLSHFVALSQPILWPVFFSVTKYAKCCWFFFILHS